jgi:SMC interacting uncharacterized protein involved in chromosome segregation
MLTDEDIKKLIGVFSTREEINQRFDEVRQDFSDLQVAVDAFAKKADTYFQEMLVLSHKVERHEKGIHQIAEKSGVKLEF